MLNRCALYRATILLYKSLPRDGSGAGSYPSNAGAEDGFATLLCAPDITADVSVTEGSFQTDSATGEVLQNVVLKNIGTKPIDRQDEALPNQPLSHTIGSASYRAPRLIDGGWPSLRFETTPWMF